MRFVDIRRESWAVVFFFFFIVGGESFQASSSFLFFSLLFFHLILSLTGSLHMECKESVQPGLSAEFMCLKMMSPTLSGVVCTHSFILSFSNRFSRNNGSLACYWMRKVHDLLAPLYRKCALKASDANPLWCQQGHWYLTDTFRSVLFHPVQDQTKLLHMATNTGLNVLFPREVLLLWRVSGWMCAA